MADDKSMKDYRDKTRINMSEPYEKEYWKRKFRVSGQALAGAVRAVGPSVKKVERYLKKKSGGPSWRKHSLRPIDQLCDAVQSLLQLRPRTL
jgi:hypothetical protein